MDRNEQRESKQDKNAFFSFLEKQLITLENYNHLKKDSKVDVVERKEEGPIKCVLYLHGHPLQGEQIDYLFEFLNQHPEVFVLDLSYAKLGSRPDAEIARLLGYMKTNKTIEKLNLEGNEIDFGGKVRSESKYSNPGDERYEEYYAFNHNKLPYFTYIVPQALHDLLKGNTKLTHLLLGSNYFREHSSNGTYIRYDQGEIKCSMTQYGNNATRLNLGTAALGHGLSGNNTLRMLSIKDCKINYDDERGSITYRDVRDYVLGSWMLFEGIGRSGLTHLNLNHCGIDEWTLFGAMYDAVMTNHSLISIDYDDNPFLNPFHKSHVKSMCKKIEERLNQNREDYEKAIMQMVLIRMPFEGHALTQPLPLSLSQH